MTDPTPETRLAVLETKHQTADDWRVKTDKTLEQIAQALSALARVEYQNQTMLTQLQDLRTEFKTAQAAAEARFRPLEDVLPFVAAARSGTRSAVNSMLAHLATAAAAIGASYLGFKRLP